MFCFSEAENVGWVVFPTGEYAIKGHKIEIDFRGITSDLSTLTFDQSYQEPLLFGQIQTHHVLRDPCAIRAEEISYGYASIYIEGRISLPLFLCFVSEEEKKYH